MRALILSPDWNSVLFWRDEDSAVVEEAALPVSQALREDLGDFYNWFSEVFFAADAKPTPMDRRLLDERGVQLWERLRAELGPDYRVAFRSEEFACEFETPDEFKAAQRAAARN